MEAKTTFILFIGNPILNTTCIAPNVAKSNLDMPNIFDMLESQAPPPSQADKDDEQSEILSDLEGYNKLHIFSKLIYYLLFTHSFFLTYKMIKCNCISFVNRNDKRSHLWK